ncbi:hypothetical protein AAC387_Pa03g3587 [Persea americana]
MANRMKEDEKNEKIIRGLLKLPANRRCINCNSLGPQYVCTNFWTFICTNCSGIHREFTHRVKSVSMAKFTSQEVNALQAGGNERAKEIYFKEWDSQRHSVPDSSNVERLRDFIKHVYVDRRYTGERSVDRPPRVQGERDDSNDNRRADVYRGGSRSPPSEDTYDRRYNVPSPGGRSEDRNFRYNYDERRSPGYDQEIRRYGDYRRSPGRFEAVDDRHRDDRFGNGNPNRRAEEQRSADVASKPDGRSPDHQKNISSPPVVRPVREILGEDVPPLRVGDPPKANGGKAADVPARTQRTASSSSMGSTDGNSVELKRVNSGTLIDFSADPEPPVAAAPNDLFAAQPVQQPTTAIPSDGGGNWASFDFAAQEKAPQAPSSANTLESALSQLAPGSAPVGNNSILPVGGVDSFVTASVGVQWPTMQQHQPSLFPTPDGRSAPQQVAPVGGAPMNQPWGSFAPNPQGLLTVQPPQAVLQRHQEISSGVPSQPVPVESKPWGSFAPNPQGPFTAQPPQAALQRPQEISSGVPSQAVPVEAKPSGRKELPADLFTFTYSPAPVQVPVWQTGPPRGMGFGLHYPNAVSMPTFPQPQRSTNPFDLTNEPALVHSSSFPSMAPLQGALPNMGAPPTLMRASSFGTPSPQWAPAQVPSYPTAMQPSSYMMQQAPANISPLGHQGAGGFGNEGSIFSGMSAGQHIGPRHPQPATPDSFSSGGNPFG